MATEVLNVTSEDGYREAIRKAARILREGGLVGLPTETVYGIAASAEIPEAIARLREVKGRSVEGPLTVHIGKLESAAQFLNEVPGAGRRLISRAWPGPLTLLFDVQHPEQTPVALGKDPGFAERVYYSNTVGLRYPDCLATCEVINEAGTVVVASSANRAGRQAPTQASQVLDQLDGEIDLLIDGGETRYAGSSTVAQISAHGIRIIRQGVMDERRVHKLAENFILLVCTGNTCRSPMAESLLKAMLADQLHCDVSKLQEKGYRVVSVGTSAIDGAPATTEAVQAMVEMDIDISRHRSCGVTAEAVAQAQTILVMTESHRQAITRMAPDAANRCRLIGGGRDISDPIGSPIEVYRSCRDQIQAGLRAQLREVIL